MTSFASLGWLPQIKLLGCRNTCFLIKQTDSFVVFWLAQFSSVFSSSDSWHWRSQCHSEQDGFATSHTTDNITFRSKTQNIPKNRSDWWQSPWLQGQNGLYFCLYELGWSISFCWGSPRAVTLLTEAQHYHFVFSNRCVRQGKIISILQMERLRLVSPTVTLWGLWGAKNVFLCFFHWYDVCGLIRKLTFCCIHLCYCFPCIDYVRLPVYDFGYGLVRGI